MKEDEEEQEKGEEKTEAKAVAGERRVNRKLKQ